MKKKIIIIFIIQILIILSGIFLIILAINNSWKKEFNRFDYNTAKETTIKYLNENEEELKEMVEELYENKSSIDNSFKKLKHVGYHYDDNFNFKNEEEYIKFNIDAQGMLGGQYYGLIYSKSNNEELIIKERVNGNNTFIRKRIKNNWYFYYDDYDGKVDTKKYNI